MDQREAPLGPEEDSLLPEKTPVRDQRGLFEQLRQMGRGAVGKVLLATTLMGAADAAGAERTGRRGGADSAPAVGHPELMPTSTLAEPWAMADDGTIHNVRIDNHILPYFTKAPVGARPPAGVYKDPDTGKHIYVTHNRTRHEATLSAERAQPPEGTRWIAFKDKKTGKMFTRPQTEQELMLPRGPARGAVPSVQPLTSRGEAPDAGAVKPETFVLPSAAVRDAEEKVKKLGYLTIEHGYDTANAKEKMLRGKSLIKPERLVPVEFPIDTEIDSDGSGRVMLPCPRDIMDQLHGITDVQVFRDGKRIPVKSRIVYSQDMEAGGGKGYENPFLIIDILGKGTTGRLKIRGYHAILMPVYPPMANQQLLQAMGPSAIPIGTAAKAGAAVPWDGSINGMDPNLYRLHGKGDCGVKAAVAREAGQGLVEVLEGYSLQSEDLRNFGGMHCINLASSQGGLLTFDPRTPDNLYYGPQKDYVVTRVGALFKVKEWGNKVMQASNGGYYSGTRNYRLASTPGVQPLGPGLQPEVIEYLEALAADRMKQYDLPNIAQNGN